MAVKHPVDHAEVKAAYRNNMYYACVTVSLYQVFVKIEAVTDQ